MRFKRTALVRLIIVILLMSVSTVSVALPWSAQADSLSALDGVGEHTVCQMARYCAAQLITTTKSNDIVILIVESQSSPTPSIIDSSGLTFTQRLSDASSTSNFILWEYYALAVSPLSNDNVTVVDQCCFVKNGMQVFAVHGANTGSIFDANLSAPATVSCPGPSCGNCRADINNPGVCSTSIQTSPVDFVIAITAINDANLCGHTSTKTGPVVPGFANISPGTGTFKGDFEVDYAVTSNSQTSVRFNCTGTDAMAIALDAIALVIHNRT